VTPPLPCRLIVDDIPQNGMRNMQIDEHLLDTVLTTPLCSYTRIYRWNEPTVSLGYFQADDAEVDTRLRECARVRRMTGGGAILHHREITYSCAVPACHSIRKTPVELYERVHTAIIELLERCGVPSAMRKDTVYAISGEDSNPFLCFLRSDPRDIVCAGQKIVGSAQRRRKGNILQHGSVLVEASPLTPELKGILDIFPKFDQRKFEEQIGPQICSVISEP
jgi:lipoate-protein ligase A